MDISGIDRERLLYELWKVRQWDTFWMITQNRTVPFDDSLAKKFTDRKIKILCGKPMYLDLTSDVVDFTSYNKYAGPGTAELIIHKLKNGLL